MPTMFMPRGGATSDQFVVLDDDSEVDVFVARDHGKAVKDAPAIVLEEVRGNILSLLIQHDEVSSMDRSLRFYAAMDDMVNYHHRLPDLLDAPPTIALPVISLPYNLYQSPGDLKQTTEFPSCRDAGVVSDLNVVLDEFGKIGTMRHKTDSEIRSMRWELMRRFTRPMVGEHAPHLIVKGTHSNVLSLCNIQGDDSLVRLTRMQGHAHAATDAEGRMLFSGELISTKYLKGIALVTRKEARNLVMRGKLRIRNTSILPDLATASNVMPRLGDTARDICPDALSVNAVLRAFRTTYLDARDQIAVIDLVTENVENAVGTEPLKKHQKNNSSEKELLKSHNNLSSPTHFLTMLRELVINTNTDDDQAKQRTKVLQSELSKINVDDASCDMSPFGPEDGPQQTLQRWIRYSANVRPNTSIAPHGLSCAQGHMQLSDAVMSAASYTFDHIRTVDPEDACRTQLRAKMIRHDITLLQALLQSTEPSPDALINLTQAFSTWGTTKPWSPVSFSIRKKDEDLLSGRVDSDTLTDLDAVVLAQEDWLAYHAVQYPPGILHSNNNALRSAREDLLSGLEQLLGISPPLQNLETMTLLNRLDVIVPPGGSKADLQLRNELYNLGRRRGELMARYRGRKIPYEQIHAQLKHKLVEIARIRTQVEETSVLSVLMMLSIDTVRLAAKPSPALAVCTRQSSSSRRSRRSVVSSTNQKQLLVCAARTMLSGRVPPDKMPSSKEISKIMDQATAEAQLFGPLLSNVALQHTRVLPNLGDRPERIWAHFRPETGSKRQNQSLVKIEALVKGGVTTRHNCCPYPVGEPMWAAASVHVDDHDHHQRDDISLSVFSIPQMRSESIIEAEADAEAEAEAIPSPLIIMDDVLAEAEAEAAAAAPIVIDKERLESIVDSMMQSVPLSGIRELYDIVVRGVGGVGGNSLEGITPAFLRQDLCPALRRLSLILLDPSRHNNIINDDELFTALNNDDGTSYRHNLGKELASKLDAFNEMNSNNNNDALCLHLALHTMSPLVPHVRCITKLLSWLDQRVAFNRRDRYEVEDLALLSRREAIRARAQANRENMTDEQREMVNEFRRAGMTAPDEILHNAHAHAHAHAHANVRRANARDLYDF